MAFNLAEMFVKIGANTAPFDAALGNVKGNAQQTGGLLAGLGGLATVGFAAAAAAAAALGAGMIYGIKRASDLNETLSKVGVVFGPATAGVVAQAEQMAKSFGLGKGEMLDAAAGIGLIGKAAGQSQEGAAAMASSLTKLAADAASFYNVPLAEALQKIKSGLVGESEPIRAFGVLLNEDAVKAEALRLGLTKGKDALSDQVKVMARASLITKGLSDASGDLERTQDSTANQMKKLTGSLANMAEEVGQALLPAVNAGLNMLTGLIDAMSSGFAAAKESIAAFAAGVVEGMATAAVVVRNAGLAWDIFKLSAGQAILNVVETLAVIPANLAIIGEWVGTNWVALITDGLNAVKALFLNFGINLGNMFAAAWDALKTGEFKFEWVDMLSGFEATAARLPEMIRPHLTSLQAEIDAKAKEMADNEAKRTAAMKAVAKPPPVDKALKDAVKGKEFKIESVGLAEFSHKLTAGIDKDKDKLAKDHLAETRKGNETLKKIEGKLGAAAVMS